VPNITHCYSQSLAKICCKPLTTVNNNSCIFIIEDIVLFLLYKTTVREIYLNMSTMRQISLEATKRLFLVGLLLLALAHVSQHELFVESDNVDCELCHLEHFPKILPASFSLLSFPVFLTVSNTVIPLVYKRFEYGVGSIRSPPAP